MIGPFLSDLVEITFFHIDSSDHIVVRERTQKTYQVCILVYTRHEIDFDRENERLTNSLNSELSNVLLSEVEMDSLLCCVNNHTNNLLQINSWV